MKVLVLALALGLAVVPGAARAEESPAPDAALGPLLAARPVVNGGLTLDEAVALALKYSPALRGAAEAAAEAAARAGLARAQTRPTVSANLFASGGSEASIMSSPMGGGGTAIPPQIMGLQKGPFADQNLLVMLPLYTGGRLGALNRQASALRLASEAEAEARRQDTVQMTRAAWRAVIALRAMAAVQQARVDDTAERLRLDRARLEQERVPAYYVLRDEAALAAARQDLTNAERDVQIARVQLRTVIGLSPASRIDVPVPTGQGFVPSGNLLPELVGPSPEASGAAPDLPALLRVAERERPELRAAGSRVGGASEAASAARGSYRPQVAAFGMGDLQQARGQSGFGGTSFGVAATLPLYDAGQRRAETRASDAAARQAEEERQRVALQIAQEVETGLLNLRAAETNIATADAALSSAREEYRVAGLRYDAGRAVVTEVLDALTARVQAEANIVQAVYQYNLAADQLRRAVGRP